MTGMDKGDGEIRKWMKEDVNDGRWMKDGGRKGRIQEWVDEGICACECTVMDNERAKRWADGWIAEEMRGCMDRG